MCLSSLHFLSCHNQCKFRLEQARRTEPNTQPKSHCYLSVQRRTYELPVWPAVDIKPTAGPSADSCALDCSICLAEPCTAFKVRRYKSGRRPRKRAPRIKIYSKSVQASQSCSDFLRAHDEFGRSESFAPAKVLNLNFNPKKICSSWRSVLTCLVDGHWLLPLFHNLALYCTVSRASYN